MRVVHLIAGAGGMYCGSCLHGSTLVSALRRAGVDCVLQPLYTPVKTEEDSAGGGRLAFGGINVFLQQKSWLFRHTPWAVDWLLDRPALLRLAMRFAGGTRPEKLGALTVSMLEGPRGRQRKELEKLVRRLQTEPPPQIIHLNNLLLVGLAGDLSRRLSTKLVCTLAGEDAFIERLPSPYHQRTMELVRQRCSDLAAMIAPNRYYADRVAAWLSVPRARIDVVPLGIELGGHECRQRPARPHDEGAPFTIGWLARVTPDKGLHLLVEAVGQLAADKSLPPLRLSAAGYLDPAERPYLDEVRRQAQRLGIADRFVYRGELDRPAKLAFLPSLDLFALPTIYAESKGLPLLEAWAHGVPAVVPNHGTFPELVADTGGGLLHEPGCPAALAEALRQLILNPQQATELGQRGFAAVQARYHADRMAADTLAVYQRCVGIGD